MGAGPAGSRIGGRDELRRHFGCCAEGGIIEHRQVFLNRPASCLGRQTSRTLDAFLTARVRFDQAAVHGKTLATNKAFFNTTAKHSLEETPKKIALTEAAMPVL